VGVRRRLHDVRLANLLSLLTPFVAYLPAEMLHVSGVVAVVTCGLALTQAGPRVVDAQTRVQARAFWTLTTFLLNGALFVLVGLQLHVVVEGLDVAEVVAGLGTAVVVWTVVVGTRLLWTNTLPYVIRAIDRRPAQRLRRVGFRQRQPGAWAGFRGAVSLAAALAVPAVHDGEAVVGRDMLLLVTFGVIALTLVVQGLTLPAVVRWARLPDDPRDAAEERLARQTATRAALAALDQRAIDLGVPDAVAGRVREEYSAHLATLELKARVADGGLDLDHTIESMVAERSLRLALLADKRTAVLRLRQQREIDDTVLRRVQAQLDVEEVRLAGVLEDD
jgi:CPA1 family monovalent cation:H+ antiporter